MKVAFIVETEEEMTPLRRAEWEESERAKAFLKQYNVDMPGESLVPMPIKSERKSMGHFIDTVLSNYGKNSKSNRKLEETAEMDLDGMEALIEDVEVEA